MALPRVEVEITADTKRAEAGFDRVEKGMAGVGAAADRAASRTDRLGTTLNRNTGRSSAFGRGIQNASFQLGDFATQVGAGTSASIALGQQLPQLLGGFGIMGAVLGAVVAVAVPLARAFQGLAGDSENLERALGTLSPMAGVIADAFREVRDMGVQMAEVVINNLDRILITAGTVATFFAGRWVTAFVAARVATFSLAGALATLRTALIRTGIGAVVVAAGELIYQFTRLVKATGSFGEAMKLLGEIGVGALKAIGENGGRVLELGMKAVFHGIEAGFLQMVANMQETLAGFFRKVSSGLQGVPGLGGVADTLGTAAIDLQSAAGATRGSEEMPLPGTAAMARESAASYGSQAAGLAKIALDAIPGVQKLRDLLASMKEENLSLPDILGVGGGEDGEQGAGAGGGEDRDASLLVQGLANAREQLEIWYADMKEMLESASEDELSVIGGYNEAKLRLEEEYQRRLKQIKQQGASAEIQTVIGAGQQILQAMGQTNKKALQIAAAFGAAKALVNTMEGASKELAKGGLAGIAKAAAVIAAGMNFVNSIRSIGSSGATGVAMAGGVSAASAAGSTTVAAPAQPEVSRSVAIRLEGDTFGRDRVISLINEINEAVEDGAVVRLA